MEESDGGIVCIQHGFVEYASASHDALDKTAAHLLLSPESQSHTSTKESGIKMSIYHLQLLDPWGPSVRHITIRPIEPLLYTIGPLSPLTASPPH